jgi:tRNA U34 2-thiouridine synthase MnmA/TrmU
MEMIKEALNTALDEFELKQGQDASKARDQKLAAKDAHMKDPDVARWKGMSDKDAYKKAAETPLIESDKKDEEEVDPDKKKKMSEAIKKEVVRQLRLEAAKKAKPSSK